MAKINFDTRVYQIELTFESIKDYYELSAKTLNKELSELHDKFERQTKDLFTTDNEHYHDLLDSFVTYTERITDSFTRNFNYSFITLIYTFLESSLNDLCLILKEKNSIDLDLKDLKGDGIFRSKNYLKKVCKINFDEGSYDWNEIVKLNAIRNCIVHTNGIIKKTNDPTKLKNIISSLKTITIKDDEYLNISNKYIENIIQSVHSFLSKLFRENVEYGFYYKL